VQAQLPGIATASAIDDTAILTLDQADVVVGAVSMSIVEVAPVSASLGERGRPIMEMSPASRRCRRPGR
jgi:hypothetical protein